MNLLNTHDRQNTHLCVRMSVEFIEKVHEQVDFESTDT